MPMLFYGTTDLYDTKRRLYNDNRTEITTSIFDRFKRLDSKSIHPDDIPEGKGGDMPDVAYHWHFEDVDHSALAWFNERWVPQTVFVPGLVTWRRVLTPAREVFREWMPSSIVFRVYNRKAYVYEPS